MASWFGATTDTTKISDNSPAIQNALNAMPHDGELVFEEAGFYDCYNTIIMPDYDDYPDYVQNLSYVKAISLTGVSPQAGYSTENIGSTLRYVGPNKDVETPFFDFRGSYSPLSLGGIGRIYKGCIKDLTFAGLDSNNNIVGLWFAHAMDAYFSRCFCWRLTNGIRIDGHYYYTTFFRIHCRYCKYGFKALSLANHASFYACVFSSSSIAGMSLSSDVDNDTGVIIYSCYFEANATAIEANIAELLVIKNSYFERNSGYLVDVSNESLPTDWHNSILVMHNCFMNIDCNDIVSNKAVIKQTSRTGAPITYSLENNSIYNQYDHLDSFIYVESGDLKIKAENNLFVNTQTAFPASSKLPLDTSSFNNDFTV